MEEKLFIFWALLGNENDLIANVGFNLETKEHYTLSWNDIIKDGRRVTKRKIEIDNDKNYKAVSHNLCEYYQTVMEPATVIFAPAPSLLELHAFI